MGKLLKFIKFGLVFCILGVSGFYVGYYFYNPINKIVVEKNPYLNYISDIEKETVETNLGDSNKIEEKTKIIYEYYYPTSNKVTSFERNSPKSLINLTRADLIKFLPDWQIMSFSNKDVKLRKTVDTEYKQNYITGEHQGYIAIYSNDNNKKGQLIDVTNKFINSLEQEEIDKIKLGVELYGNEDLISFLEDYET